MEPAARDDVRRSRVLDHVQRVLVAHVDDGRADLDPLRPGPDRGQERERRRQLLGEVVDPEVRAVRAPIAASSGNGEASCWAKWWTRKYAPSAPRASTASASSIDWMSASDPERTCEYGAVDQCPNERNPIFFTSRF